MSKICNECKIKRALLEIYNLVCDSLARQSKLEQTDTRLMRAIVEISTEALKNENGSGTRV
jgi:hypothetical protein